MPQTDQKPIEREVTATPLTYAASLLRDRVSIERGTNYLRVITPPMASWRKLPLGYFIAGAFLGLYIVVGSINGAVTAAASFAGVLFVICMFAYDRVRRAFVFELTDRTFALTRLSPWGPLTARLWRRDAIGTISVVHPPGTIMIQVLGWERITLWLGPDPTIAESVATALREGLAAAVVPTERAKTLPPGEIHPPSAMPHGAERITLLAVAFALASFGVVIGVVFANVYIAMIPMILAGIPAGMALGTQKKDYYG